MDDLETLLLAGASNLDGSQVVSLTGELDSLDWLDVTGLWGSFDPAAKSSLLAWDAMAGNTLVVPEPAMLAMLCMVGLGLLFIYVFHVKYECPQGSAIERGRPHKMFGQLRMRYVLMFVVMGTLGITAATASEIVNFADAELEIAVRDELGIPKPTPITDTDMEGLTALSAGLSNIRNIEGLEYGTNLTYLFMAGNQVSDISPISRLTNLTYLYLFRNQISNVSTISELTNLNVLYLTLNQISDVSVISGLTNLTELHLNSNQVSDISPISGLTNLTELNIRHNLIRTLDLQNSNLSSLEDFDIGGNPLRNVLLTNATLSQSVFDVLMDGGRTPNIGIAELGGVLSLDMSGVDFADTPDLSEMHTMDDLETLLLAGTSNLDGSQVVSLTGELDSLDWLDVKGLWGSFDPAAKSSLLAWDAMAGNTLVVPEPAMLAMLGMVGLGLLVMRAFWIRHG